MQVWQMTGLRFTVLVCCVMASGVVIAQAQPEPALRSNSRGELFQGARYSTTKLARIWGLKEEEIERYQALKIADQHYSDPKITPYEVLGKYARTPEEAERYAAIVIEKELEQYIRAMDWAATVDNVRKARPIEAQLDLLQSSRVVQTYLKNQGIDVDGWIGELSGTSLNRLLDLDVSGGNQRAAKPVAPRVSYFVDARACDQSCELGWDQLRGMQTLKAVSGIDVIFVGENKTKPSKLEVSSWAQARGISVEEVDRKEITLNFESTRFATIRNNRDIPVAINSLGDIIQ